MGLAHIRCCKRSTVHWNSDILLVNLFCCNWQFFLAAKVTRRQEWHQCVSTILWPAPAHRRTQSFTFNSTSNRSLCLVLWNGWDWSSLIWRSVWRASLSSLLDYNFLGLYDYRSVQFSHLCLDLSLRGIALYSAQFCFYLRTLGYWVCLRLRINIRRALP